MKTDYTLYLVTDRRGMSVQTLAEAVELAILGGCTMVQLREKEASSLDFYRQAQEVGRITRKHQVPLIINDRVDIALAIEAEGVHMGQDDLPIPIVRKMIGDKGLIGVSVSSVKEAKRAIEDGADYLGVGAMFPTQTKKDARMVSIEELEKIRCMTDLPIVVIGGICKENAGMFRAMGIDGLAVISAVIGQQDIRQAAADLKRAFVNIDA